MTFDEIMAYLEEKGNDQTKKVLMKHGAREPFFGVKVGDLKPIQKKIKKDHGLSLKLYETGNSDAMYLAGLIADEQEITKEKLQDWVEQAYWYMISEYTVAWVAAESKFGWELAGEWIESDKEMIAAAGWSTYTSLLSITSDDDIDIPLIELLMKRAAEHVHDDESRVSYAMNGFILGAGAFVESLTEKAMKLGEEIGKVTVYMGETNCKVPEIVPYLNKMKTKGYIGKKKKMARC
ncbi:MAG: DNA alkylation repair protein [Balneolaceae bacterium]|nr:DNA alkylation repair protein [Balneolaceae bacterium]